MVKTKGKRGKAIKHGILAYIQTGEFHPTQRKRRLLSKELEEMKNVLKSQTPNQSMAKEMLIADAVFCQGIMDLAMLYINKVGLFEEGALKRGKLELQPIIKNLASFMNTKRLNLMAVGLESGADDVLTPLQIAARYDEDKAKKK
jgi:hypothetical protein